MPLVKQQFTLAAGATSAAVLTGTTYEYVDAGVRIVVAAAADKAGDVTMDFTMNNTELTKNGVVSEVVTGEPFGWRGNYVMNDTQAQGDIRNRPIITFTNSGTESAVVDVAIFIGL